METTKQKTLKGSFSLFGKGLHTGLSLTVTFNPAPDNTGYKIQRIDLEGQPIIDAIAENVIDTQRGTVIAKGEARVSTIEHGMAALYAMGQQCVLLNLNSLAVNLQHLTILINLLTKYLLQEPLFLLGILCHCCKQIL